MQSVKESPLSDATNVLICEHLFPHGWNNNTSLSGASLFTGGTVVLLNSPDMTPSYFDQLWTEDKFRVCVDGAANRLYAFQGKRRGSSVLLPDVIVGDFDSARPEVLEHYEKNGVELVHRSSQESTDFQKALVYHRVDDARHHRGGACAVLGGLGGFLSHQLGNLHELLSQSLSPSRVPLYFMSEHEICFVMRPGRTSISCNVDAEHPIMCSMIPLFGPVSSVTTQGLQWDVTQQCLAFGSSISTSNVVVEPLLSVECTEPLLWIFDDRQTEKKSF